MKKSIKLEKIVGIILLIPPLLGVIFFILTIFGSTGDIPRMNNLGGSWSGDFGYAWDAGGGGYSSSAPIYLGLMAIAGALLLKGTGKDLNQ